MAVGHYNPRDKDKMQQWAHDLVRGDFVVLDTETTGLGSTDEVVQIGIIDSKGRTLLDTLVRPTRPVPSVVTRIHGLTNEKLAEASPFCDHYVMLSSMLAGRVVIAYNMDFDWRMLVQSARVYGLPPFRTGDRQCAMKAYAQFHGMFDLKRRTYSYQKLGEACRHQKIPVIKAHDALSDARMTLALVKKMAEFHSA
jgi:DNA polymerase III subunit epsilon